MSETNKGAIDRHGGCVADHVPSVVDRDHSWWLRAAIERWRPLRCWRAWADEGAVDAGGVRRWSA